MHPSPVPSSHSIRKHEDEDCTSFTKSILFFGSLLFLVMTSLSCFATSYIVTSTLIDWPLGSVVEKRSRLYNLMTSNNNNKIVVSNTFSLLHAALQREDHCHDETKEQLDRALGIFTKNEIQNVIDKVRQSQGKILAMVDVSLKLNEADRDVLIKRNSKKQQQRNDGGGGEKQIQYDENGNVKVTLNRLNNNNYQHWNVPRFALRASKFQSHELDMFFAKKNKKQRNDDENNNDDAGGTRITSVTAIATAFSNMVNFMNVLAGPLKEGNALVYARNTVDKLLYQLRNFEPLTKRIQSPQWNPVTGLITPSQQQKQQSHQLTSKNSKDCPKYKKLILGLSSVNRKKNYLFQTVSSLLSSLSKDELKDITIVVLNADVPPTKNEDVKNLHAAFEKYFSDGTLMVIEREDPNIRHPEMRGGVSSLAHRWGDDDDRVWWRSKQVLDVAYLMDWVASRSYDLLTLSSSPSPSMTNGQTSIIKLDADRTDEEQEKCKHLGGYFLMLEDDISATKHYSTKIMNWVHAALFKPKDVSWTVASFYNPWPVKDKEKLPPFKFFGVIGQLFRIHELPTMVEFLRTNFDQSPLDWLFVDYLKKMGGQMVVHTPSMFQHEGVVSSLEGKTQDGRAVDFREN